MESFFCRFMQGVSPNRIGEVFRSDMFFYFEIIMYLCSRETDDDTSDRTCGVAIGYGTGSG